MNQRIFIRKNSWLRTLLLLIVGLLVVIQPATSALSTQDVVDIKWNRALYDINDGQECETSDGGSDQIAPLTGNDSEKWAWGVLRGRGLSPEQAAGIIGNLIAESSLDPRADNNGNYKGIAQWSTSDRWPRLVTWAQNNGLEIYKFDTQFRYLLKEATERGNIAGIKQHNDIPHTAWYWGRYFEVAIIGGSTSETPLTNVQDLEGRTAAAQDVFNRLSDSAVPTDPGATTGTTSCPTGQSNNGGGGNGPIGIGEGGFTDSGEVSGWPSILANSQLSEKVYGDSLEWRGACASIVSRVWRGQDIGFGFAPLYAMTIYNQHPQYVHKNKKPKKGSILLYTGSTQYGHVTIYLGNNKILNDGHITNASTKEEDYLGWADPNDFGWHTQRYQSEAAIRAVLNEYLSW